MTDCLLCTLRRKAAIALDPSLRHTGVSLTNVAVIALIIISLFVVALESEPTISQGYEIHFSIIEWFFLFIFGIEYITRVWASIENPKYTSRLRYMLTPVAILDLMAVLVMLVSFYGSGGFLLRLARILRVLRMARLGRFSSAFELVMIAVSRRKFELFLSGGIALLLLYVSSAFLYLVEGSVQPDAFGSIPRAMWWSVATLTTVGYGDIYPVTAFGKVFASLTAVSGIGLIAMPTGILAAAFSEAMQESKTCRRESNVD